MHLRKILLAIALAELVVALILYKLGIGYTELLFGGAIAFVLAELLRKDR